jgi:hypothetical protein
MLPSTATPILYLGYATPNPCGMIQHGAEARDRVGTG